jgi:hypothetical protein
LAACQFDSTIAPSSELEIACRTSADCPTGWICRDTIGRCVPSEALDTEPPHALDLVVTPAAGTVGTVFTVAFDVSEPLRADPTVVVDVGRGDTSLTMVSPDGSQLATRYAFRGSA